MQKEALILGCSEAKKKPGHAVPAIMLYDGPMFQTLRKHIRDHGWPKNLGILILSAKYGLIPATQEIEWYDQILTEERSRELLQAVRHRLEIVSRTFRTCHVVAGEMYASLIRTAARPLDVEVNHVLGDLFEKRKWLIEYLNRRRGAVRERIDPRLSRKVTFFFPDWEDFVPKDYDPETHFDGSDLTKERIHVTRLAEERMCDGILASAAHYVHNKGPFKKRISTMSLPLDLRAYYDMDDDVMLFGDCGAFTYVNEQEPPVSCEGVALRYHVSGVDVGANVDHIPAPFLPIEERARRIALSTKLAERFLDESRRFGSFFPVGVAHGITPDEYGQSVRNLVDMGYEHIAIGGLVFRKNNELVEIMRAIYLETRRLKNKPWIHMFGVYRPSNQHTFYRYGADSFDCATYFRRSWLRKEQNYAGPNGTWYAAIRIPALHYHASKGRLKDKSLSDDTLRKMEREAFEAMLAHGRGELGIDDTLHAVLRYDSLFHRDDLKGTNMYAVYKRTLEDRPWERCGCSICTRFGIHVVIMRGAMRNRLRGTHNTIVLYKQIMKSRPRVKTWVQRKLW